MSQLVHTYSGPLEVSNDLLNVVTPVDAVADIGRQASIGLKGKG
jgi:hypothetical protein